MAGKGVFAQFGYVVATFSAPRKSWNWADAGFTI
jgi:hypothetical protein